MCPTDTAALDGKVNKAGDTMSGALLVPYTRLTGIVGTDYKGLVDFGYNPSDDSYMARIGYHTAYGLYADFDNGAKTLKFPNASGTLFSSAGGTITGSTVITAHSKAGATDGKNGIYFDKDGVLFLCASANQLRMQRTGESYHTIVSSKPLSSSNAVLYFPTGSGTLAIEPTRKSVSPAAVSAANSTATAVASISLEAGSWLIIGRALFSANSTGSRQLKLSESSGDTSNSVSSMTSLGASPGTLIAEVTWTYSNTSTKTVYLNAWQNSGGALSIQGCIIALKYA